MRKFFLTSCVVSFIWVFISQAETRPPPVPDDEKKLEHELERYERDKEKLTTTDQLKPRGHAPGQEDPEDASVVYELHLQGLFVGIPRRNRKEYPKRPNIFQPWIDNAKVSTETQNYQTKEINSTKVK